MTGSVANSATSNIKSIKLRKTVKEGPQSSPSFAYQRRERRSWLLFIQALIVQIMHQVTPSFCSRKSHAGG